jgi:integrase
MQMRTGSPCGNKTGKRLVIPIHPVLQAVLAQTPRENLTFLVTAYGKPFTSNGFGNWFRDRCNEAGLPQCSAHGLRKAGTRRLAEGGKSNPQIKAVTGHTTDSEVSRYTAEADQKKLARQALGMEEEQKLSNRKRKLPHYTTVMAERPGISWNEGFISCKEGSSSWLIFPALSCRRYRAIWR